MLTVFASTIDPASLKLVSRETPVDNDMISIADGLFRRSIHTRSLCEPHTIINNSLKYHIYVR